MSDLLDLVFSAVIWRVVGEWVRAMPPGVQVLFGIFAAVGFVMVRQHRRRPGARRRRQEVTR